MIEKNADFGKSFKRAVSGVTPYERADAGYADAVARWLADPHAYFKAFGPEARAFQRAHPSERLRTMTLVAEAARLAPLRPVCLALDGAEENVTHWEGAFAVVAGRLLAAHPETFAALQCDGHLVWLGCPADGVPVAERFAAGALDPEFADVVDVVGRLQWLFLVCGIRLNEVIVQVDPYTDEAWDVRRAELKAKRAAECAFMRGRRAAQKKWAAEHPGEETHLPPPRKRAARSDGW